MVKRLFLALALGFALTACSESEQNQADRAAGNTELANTSEAKISVPTVQCGSCQANIESALKKLEGVKSAKVNLDTKIALVSYDAMKADLAALENAITKAGYDANSTKRDATAYAELDACCKLPEDR
ncbi:hypothetical protein DCC62_06775 [candidate division KSB1 bacterium]|nr:MAG: hypothetical protein DCC62_06775 [candidate division KSB1 bacterium]